MLEQIKKIDNLDDLQKLYGETFGKNGTMTARLKEMKSLNDTERAALNIEKEELTAAFKTRQTELEDAAMMSALAVEKIDMTRTPAPVHAGRIHPLARAYGEISTVFATMGYDRASGPEIEDDWYNFTALNMLPNHPARDMQDTFFIEGGNVMRTQTSDIQIREMEKRGAPIKIFSPGAVYRREMDATHFPTFSQVEGLYIDTDITMTDLITDIKIFLSRFFERDAKIRVRPSYFPFTEPSIEFDMDWNGKWLELGGAGMVHPNVLKNAGVDATKFQGFAFGLGIDRLAMLKYGINDGRKFYDGDIRG